MLCFFNEIMGRNPETIGDMEIYDVVTDMNRIPFIQTHKCCRGHIINTKIDYKSPYMFFYFSDYENGVNLSNTIFETIQNHSKQKHDSNIFTEIRMGGYILSLEEILSI